MSTVELQRPLFSAKRIGCFVSGYGYGYGYGYGCGCGCDCGCGCERMHELS